LRPRKKKREKELKSQKIP